jgi:hypothetical protein
MIDTSIERQLTSSKAPDRNPKTRISATGDGLEVESKLFETQLLICD